MDINERELEEIRKRKLRELQERMMQAQAEEALQEEKAEKEEALRKMLLSRILTPEAKERLARVRMVKPELATSVENYLIMLYQAGKVRGKIDDKTLKMILQKLDEKSRREFRIRF